MKTACRALQEIVRSYNKNSQKPISETKLTGLFYLFERLYYVENNYTLTGVSYTNYSKGPHSEELEDLIRESTVNHLFHSSGSTDDRYTRYELCNCPVHQSEADLSEEICEMIDTVIETYSSKKESELIEQLKSLPEITDKEKYALIDFRDIKPED